MWFKNGLGASALYLSLRPVTVGSGRIDCDLWHAIFFFVRTDKDKYSIFAL